MDALTIFADGTFVNSMVVTLSKPPLRDGGISAFAAFYCRLLDRASDGRTAQELPLLNALAFGSRDLLPRMWR